MSNITGEDNSENTSIDLNNISRDDLDLINNVILKRMAERVKTAQALPRGEQIGHDSHQSIHARIGIIEGGKSVNSTLVTPELAPSNLAPFVPTPHDVVYRMLELANVNNSDIIYDLGCGDGRIVIEAAQRYGACGVGIDIEPYYVAKSRANAKNAGVDHLTDFTVGDVMGADVSPATVVTIYLLHWSTLQLRPMLTRQLRKGTRIVSHNRSMGDWEPTKIENFTDTNGAMHTIYLWIFDGKARA